MDIFHRTKLIIGDKGLDRLRRAHVAVFGVGGVGSYAVEGLIRAGIGTLTMVDFDRVIASNINRQLHARVDTIDQVKVDLMAERCRSINPDADIRPLARKFDLDSADELLASEYDYVVDAIDSLSFKVHLLASCVERQLPVISSMGAAGKLHPEAVQVGDLFSTRHCPLARLVRKRLRRRGITGGIPAVYSEEMPILAPAEVEFRPAGETTGLVKPHGTISYMPAIFGLHCAAHVIQSLLQEQHLRRRGATPREPRPATLPPPHTTNRPSHPPAE